MNPKRPSILNRALWLALLIAFGISWTVATADDADKSRRAMAVPVDGKPFSASLGRIDANWRLTLDAHDSRHVFDARDLVVWGARPQREGGPQIVLADGGILFADVLSISGQQLMVESQDLWEKVKLPIEMVRGVVFQPPADPLSLDKLIDRIGDRQGESDELVLKNGDALKGTLIGSAPVAPDQLPTKFTFEVDGRRLEVPRDSIVAVKLNPALVNPSATNESTAWIGLRDGSHLLVERVIAKSNRLQLLLPGDVELETYPDFTPETLWRLVTLVQPRTPRVVYISDLTPVGYKHIPFLELTWPYHTDRNVLGGRLRCAGKLFARGLGMHSASRLAYDLNGRYRRFEAALGIDDLAGLRGSVTLRVYCQGADGEWQVADQSPIVRGEDDALPISADVTGVRRMALIIDFADRGDVGDHANLLNARLIK